MSSELSGNPPSDPGTPADVTHLNGHGPARRPGSFDGASVVQVLNGDAIDHDAVVVALHPARVTITPEQISAIDGDFDWSWMVGDLEAVIHATDSTWTIFVVPGISDFGVEVPPRLVDEFRSAIAALPGVEILQQHSVMPAEPETLPDNPDLLPAEPETLPDDSDVLPADPETLPDDPMSWPPPGPLVIAVAEPLSVLIDSEPAENATTMLAAASVVTTQIVTTPGPDSTALAGIDARNISAWFGSHQVLDRVTLTMQAGEVTALIGPSGCGKSTFLRILNRMHEMIPSAAMAGEVMLDGHDVYEPSRKLIDARREIGMVFQKPNPFPSMSIYDNVVASLRLTGTKASTEMKDELVETCLTKAGLWLEVRDRLRQPGGGLSGGQQQRLCIARALAIRPWVLLMDEPCSALDPTSTRRIEETVVELVSEVTIVIVTHNMQQAARVSDRCAFFLAEQGTPGYIVEHGPTSAMFGSPQDSRTHDYVNGRFG